MILDNHAGCRSASLISPAAGMIFMVRAATPHGGSPMIISNVLRDKEPGTVTVRETDLVRTAIAKLADHHIGAVVVEDRWMKVVGLFAEQDLVMALAHHGARALDMPLEKVMNRLFATCRPADQVDVVLAMMTRGRRRHVLVMEGEHLAGIVSLGDLAKRRLREKELETDTLRDLVRLQDGMEGHHGGPAH
jgi:CBS domain-containing protein